MDLVPPDLSSKILDLPTVNGIGTGCKWVNDQPTDEPAIVIFVSKKLPRQDVIRSFSATHVVPQEIDGIATDIIEVGQIYAQNFRSHMRPIKPGISCSHQKVTAGTIGGFFYDKDHQLVALSNCHVLANENNAKTGDLIFQPGSADARGGTAFHGWEHVTNHNYFATLKDFELIRSGANQDSAIAAVHPSVIEAGLIDFEYPQLGRSLAGFANPLVNSQVQKVGRTTGYTTGRIMAINAKFKIGFSMGPIEFVDCVVITSMSKSGDSGSLILDMNMNAVALLFAGSDRVTLANPIQNCIDKYGLSIPVFSQSEQSWKSVTSDGSITEDDGSYTIKSSKNAHNFITRSVDEFEAVEAKFELVGDCGNFCMPGISLVFDCGSTLKLAAQPKGNFGIWMNGQLVNEMGKFNREDFPLCRIAKSDAGYCAQFVSSVNDSWLTISCIPHYVLPNKVCRINVGKTNRAGLMPTERVEIVPCSTDSEVIVRSLHLT